MAPKKLPFLADRINHTRQAMKPMPFTAEIILVLLIPLFVAPLAFFSVAALFPLSDSPEDENHRLLRNSMALFITIVASALIRKRLGGHNP